MNAIVAGPLNDGWVFHYVIRQRALAATVFGDAWVSAPELHALLSRCVKDRVISIKGAVWPSFVALDWRREIP